MLVGWWWANGWAAWPAPPAPPSHTHTPTRSPPHTHTPHTQAITPVEYEGVKAVSFGFAGQGSAIMRGPMVSGLVQQLLLTAEWGPLDYLVVDFPPGTGGLAGVWEGAEEGVRGWVGGQAGGGGGGGGSAPANRCHPTHPPTPPTPLSLPGDIQLTLCQSVQFSAAVIVTTPQKLAYVDVAKGVRMFAKLQVWEGGGLGGWVGGWAGG